MTLRRDGDGDDGDGDDFETEMAMTEMAEMAMAEMALTEMMEMTSQMKRQRTQNSWPTSLERQFLDETPVG